MSFVQRLLTVTFQLATGTFTGSQSNQVTLSRLRATARIANAGAPSGSQLDLSVYGMSLELMNQLSTLGMVVQLVPRNTVTVTAGDQTSGMGTVFVGTILNAWGDFGAAPEVPFRVQANSGIAELVAPVSPSSFQGSADVVTMLSGIATQIGYQFENNGMSGVKVSNPYLPGTALEQARRIARSVANTMGYDDSDHVISIWPKSGGSRGGAVPLISPSTGMVGYPSFVAQGISLKTVFNPSVKFMGKVQVQGSQLTPANGTWAVFSLDHMLDALMPHGEWSSTLGCFNPNYSPPLPSK